MDASLHASASSLAGAFSPRAGTALRRGWELAETALSMPEDTATEELSFPPPRPGDRAREGTAPSAGPGPMTAEVLRETFRGIVVRFRRGDRSVVLKHFRRRDGAVNSGGFGYLRARYGAETLSAAARVLAHDDASRILLFEDLGRFPTLESLVTDPDRSDEERRALLRGWLRDWPRLVRRHDSAQADAFVRGLVGADPRAGGPDRAGGLPSVGLLERAGVDPATRRWVLSRCDAVLWCGDAHPENVVLRFPHLAAGEDGQLQEDRPMRQRSFRGPFAWSLMDLEGSCLVPPGLLVAEVALALPLVPDDPSPRGSHASTGLVAPRIAWREVLSPGEWREEAAALAEHWQVADAERARGEVVLLALRAQLRPTDTG